MTTPDDLDAGLDAGLHTYRPTEVILLIAGPGMASADTSTVASWLLLLPCLWSMWSIHRRRAARR